MAPVNKAFTCQSADVTVFNTLESISSEVYLGQGKSMYCIATVGYGDLIYSCRFRRYSGSFANMRMREYDDTSTIPKYKCDNWVVGCANQPRTASSSYTWASNARCVLMDE